MQKSFQECGFYILFVDDEEMILRELSNIYKNHFQILTAISVDDAIKELEDQKIAIAIVDFDMPEKDGIELLKIIHGKFPIIRRVMLTGKQEVLTIIRAINEGKVHYFLNKPIKISKLDDILQTHAEIYLKKEMKEVQHVINTKDAIAYRRSSVIGKRKSRAEFI